MHISVYLASTRTCYELERVGTYDTYLWDFNRTLGVLVRTIPTHSYTRSRTYTRVSCTSQSIMNREIGQYPRQPRRMLKEGVQEEAQGRLVHEPPAARIVQGSLRPRAPVRRTGLEYEEGESISEV